MSGIDGIASWNSVAGFSELHIEAGGVAFCGVTGGSGGPPVLLLHGYPQTHLAWRHVAPRLAQSFTVVAPDLPGYGSSRPDSDRPRWTKRRVASALIALMAKLGHRRFAVVGHDRGARAGYRLALDYPGQVTHFASLAVIPTLDAWDLVDERFGRANFHWFFLAQPFGLPEKLLSADPQAFIDAALARMAGGLTDNEIFLFREESYPVCSPILLKQPREDKQFDLTRYTLIEEDPAPDQALAWSYWLDRLKVSADNTQPRLRFSHYGVALSAAIDGLGVALGRSPMINAELEAGRLVRPYGDNVKALAPHVYALTWPEGLATDQRLMAFRDFALDEACGCELAAGPCGAPPSAEGAPAVNWSGDRAARRRAALSGI